MQLQSAMAIMPTNCNTILKWLQLHTPVAMINHTYCNTFSPLHYWHILQPFYGKVAIRPPMATKLVVLQSCGMALEVNPCSVAIP